MIRYTGGPIVNSTFSVGTSGDMNTAIQTALTAAGWTGMQSVDPRTSFGAWQADPVTFSMSNLTISEGVKIGARVGFADGAIVYRHYYLLADITRTYRIIADPFQFFIFQENAFSAYRSFIAGGVPYLDEGNPNTSGNTSWWLTGNAVAETDTAPFTTFRTDPFVTSDAIFYQNTSGVAVTNGQEIVISASPLETALANQSTPGVGVPRLMWVEGNKNQNARRWHNNETLKIPPTLAFGEGTPPHAGSAPLPVSEDAAIGRIAGELWDSFLSMERKPADITMNADGHNWWSVMQGASCSLWVATD